MREYVYHQPPDGDVNQGWTLVAVCWAFVICAFITTALRVFVRSRITKNFGADDLVMVIAMATTIIGAVFITMEVVNGLGRHEYYLTRKQRRLFEAIGWADWIQSFLTLSLVKASLCLFLMRIVDSRKVNIFLWSLIGFLFLFTAVCCALFFAICRPLKAYWDVGVEGKCLSKDQIRNVVIAQGVLSAVTDLICAAFPIIVLRNLQIRLRTKIALCALMGLGVITVATCVVRTVLSGAVTDPDVTWAITTNVGWRLPEVNIGIVCANAPILRSCYILCRRHRENKTMFQKTGVVLDDELQERAQSLWPSLSKQRSKTVHVENLSDIYLHTGIARGSQQSGDTKKSVDLGLPVQLGDNRV